MKKFDELLSSLVGMDLRTRRDINIFRLRITAFEGLVHDVIFIGDCKKPGRIYGTAMTGYYAAVQL